MTRPFTKDLYSDGCLHHNIERQKNWYLVVRLKLRTSHAPCCTVKHCCNTSYLLHVYTFVCVVWSSETAACSGHTIVCVVWSSETTACGGHTIVCVVWRVRLLHAVGTRSSVLCGAVRLLHAVGTLNRENSVSRFIKTKMQHV